jgi:hypothetical protein
VLICSAVSTPVQDPRGAECAASGPLSKQTTSTPRSAQQHMHCGLTRCLLLLGTILCTNKPSASTCLSVLHKDGRRCRFCQGRHSDGKPASLAIESISRGLASSVHLPRNTWRCPYPCRMVRAKTDCSKTTRQKLLALVNQHLVKELLRRPGVQGAVWATVGETRRGKELGEKRDLAS